MSNKWKIITELLLVVCLVLMTTVVGCQGSDGKTDKPSSAEDQPQEIDTSDFVEIVWYHLGDPPTNDQLDLAAEEWNKILKPHDKIYRMGGLSHEVQFTSFIRRGI